MRWRWALAGVYAMALIASYAVRSGRTEPVLPSGMEAVTVRAVGGRGASSVRLAYREYRGPHDATPILLIHGSPGESGVFAGLAPVLARQGRVLVPDLPGFGFSSTDIPDYSFRAHAQYLRDLLDMRGIARAHVLAFSMGGGVALSLADLDPDRLASLTMVSAIGVQEMELLGEYHLNHTIHGVQFGALWALSHALPHTGSLDGPLPYARNFFDSDQRPLAALLRRIQVPTLIVHGRADPLVPIEAAIEHARLVPQSELRVIEDDHFMVFEHPERIAPFVVAFLARVDAGHAAKRSEATPARLAEATAPFDPRIVPRARAVAAAVLGALMTGASAVSANVAPVAAGVLIAQGRASNVLAVVSCMLGSWLAVVRRGSVSAVARSVVNALVRVGIGILAGTVVFRTPWLAAANAWIRALAVTTLAFGAAWVVAIAFSHRRRRLLLSTWLRLTRWEYWPPWVTYLPVVVYVTWLAIKHRGVTVFTAVNPAIPAGGFIGESKIEILQGLSTSSEFVARGAFIDRRLTAAARIARAEHVMRTFGFDVPVVLKPNEGQRGSGVAVARTREELVAYLEASPADTIIQEYVPGLEFGVFYYRRPSEERGHVLSVTIKHLPVVAGNGHSTLEELILRDRRTLAMARFHFERQAARLADTPPAGQVVSLGDCGSHCRGATFLDGRSLITPALEQAFDRIARSYDGFYFGRFDVRAAATEEFVDGRAFKIIELNGVTSEATHIYDPSVGLLDAYRALFEQWRLAFEIGAENISRGAAVTSLWQLGALVARYRSACRCRAPRDGGQGRRSLRSGWRGRSVRL